MNLYYPKPEIKEFLETRNITDFKAESMYGKEKKLITVVINGKTAKRRVYWNSTDGLFIRVRNTKIFEYDF